MSKLILRTTTGEVFELYFRLNRKVAELLQHIMEKRAFSPKFRLVFNDICLNDFPDKEYSLVQYIPR